MMEDFGVSQSLHFNCSISSFDNPVIFDMSSIGIFSFNIAFVISFCFASKMYPLSRTFKKKGYFFLVNIVYFYFNGYIPVVIYW